MFASGGGGEVLSEDGLLMGVGGSKTKGGFEGMRRGGVSTDFVSDRNRGWIGNDFSDRRRQDPRLLPVHCCWFDYFHI